jgi:hypothetical protein
LICKHQVVARNDVVETALASVELTRLAEAASLALLAEPALVARRRSLSSRLIGSVRIYTQPPMSLASGRTSIEHKVAGLTYAYYLESGSLHGLRTFLGTFVSFTTDMGTERGTATFLVADVATLLPVWLREPWLREDVDGPEEVQLVGSGEGTWVFLARGRRDTHPVRRGGPTTDEPPTDLVLAFAGSLFDWVASRTAIKRGA